MQADNANVKQRILVIGAGELGLAVLRGLVEKAGAYDLSIAVLLRQSSLNTQAPAKRVEIEEIRALNIAIETADLADATVDELATVMKRYDTVISCAGFAAGRGTQRKLTDAALKAGIKRTCPGSSALTTTLSAGAALRICSMSNSMCEKSCAPSSKPNG
ncbi:Isoflavone reductase [Pseudomonas amygdali pv. aesculi]|nr:Isoflavone reductase [Pseudomonas amygdali pv. aesculi]